MNTLEQNKEFSLFQKQLQFGYNASDTSKTKQRSTDWLAGNLQKRSKNSFTTYCDDVFIDR